MSSPATSPKGFVIAGTNSGVGKTTLSLAFMAALRRRGLTVQPFKVGPDFIDPGHHTRVSGRVSRNLDGWMVDRETNLRSFRRAAMDADVVVVEGVMGLFDGSDGRSEAGSTAQMAKWLGLPVVLVVDARSMARSAGALVLGFSTFDPDLKMAGVLFNRVGSPVHLEFLRDAMAGIEKIPCLGGIPRDAVAAIPERHLGLVTGDEYDPGENELESLAAVIEENIDLDGLLASLPTIAIENEPTSEIARPAPRPRIGVARDRAFCFYYEDNFDRLREAGAELVFFSPLDDREPPADLHGLYFGGGYPEVFARDLTTNAAMRAAIARVAESGAPVYAECGGLMYLSRDLVDMDGARHEMTGVLPLSVQMLKRLRTLGYREITLAEDGLFGAAGQRARGHEFHYSEITASPEGLAGAYRMTNSRGRDMGLEGYRAGNVLASYVHLHFGSNPAFAESLVGRCRRFMEHQ